MLVNEVKKIGKVGKKLIDNEDADTIIEKIIERPMQKACKDFKNKNIETAMSSANKNNIMKNDKKILHKIDIIEGMRKHKVQTFLRTGKGYAWIMINYNTLSDENKKIVFNFVKSNYVEFINFLRRPFKIKPMVEKFDDKYAEEFKKRQLLLMYNNKYPRRAVFIRMPINEKTSVEEVEVYFSMVVDKFKSQ